MKITILAIHAHPDDVEFLAAGTLARLAADGHRVIIVTMTPGDCGSGDQPPDAIAAIRRAEAARAASRIGAEYQCAEFRDLCIFNDEPSRRRMVEILRRARPDLVLTSSPVDYLCDHEATSQLVRDACFASPAPNFRGAETDAAPPLKAIPHLYFMDPIGGVDREGRLIPPDFYVNIAESFAVKKAMLAEHESQRAWLLRQHSIDDYLQIMENWTRESGRRAGVEFAEGFRHYTGHPYPQPPLLESLLGSSVIPSRK